MINTFTLDRAARRVRIINHAGIASDMRVVELSAYVGGTSHRPESWNGHAVRYVMNNETRYEVWPEFRDADLATYVIDGIGYYVAGRSGDELSIYLHPITRITNVKTGVVSDFMLRPARRAYVMWSALIDA